MARGGGAPKNRPTYVDLKIVFRSLAAHSCTIHLTSTSLMGGCSMAPNQALAESSMLRTP